MLSFTSLDKFVSEICEIIKKCMAVIPVWQDLSVVTRNVSIQSSIQRRCKSVQVNATGFATDLAVTFSLNS